MARNVKICYVAADVAIPHFRGASTHVYEVARHLTRLGHEVHIVSRRIDYNQKRYEKIDGFHIHRIYRGIIVPLPFSSYKRLELEFEATPKPIYKPYACYLFTLYALYAGIIASRIIRRYKLDIILERETSFGAGAIASTVTRRPMVLEVIGPRYSEYSLKKAKKIIAYTKSFLHDQVFSEKLELVTAAADVNRFKPQPDKGKCIRDKYGLQDLPVVGYVGTFAEWHGVEDIISASERVLKENLSARFLMVGPYFRPTKELAEKIGVSNACIFTGPVPYNEVSKYINAADILVAPYNPARSKLGMKKDLPYSPLKVLEYMACGKPVITTSIEPITSIVRDQKTGILIPPGNADALAKAIIILIRNPSLRKEIGIRARKIVEGQYSWQIFTTRLEKILEDVMS